MQNKCTSNSQNPIHVLAQRLVHGWGQGFGPIFLAKCRRKTHLTPVSTGPTKDKIMSTNFSAPPKKASAANIKILRTPTIAKSESAALFDRLRSLSRDIAPGTNKNDQVTALIAASIGEGIVTAKKIIGLVSYFGFSPIHVAKMLEHGTGADPASGHWRRNQDGTFSLLA